jgi:hypothetical protein
MAKHIDRVPPNIDIQIQLWPIERLIPRVNNPRMHSREQIAQIAAPNREFGWPANASEQGGDMRGQRPIRQSKVVHDPLCSAGEVA